MPESGTTPAPRTGDRPRIIAAIPSFEGESEGQQAAHRLLAFMEAMDND